VYGGVSWRFFKERIEEEEKTLLSFFGVDYLDYQEQVGTGIPGIKGIRLSQDQRQELIEYKQRGGGGDADKNS
jgi:hypothetical protein